MEPRLGPTEAAFRFSYSGNDCLYRDHHGRRVIADAEGYGSFVVEKADSAILSYADEVRSDKFRGGFTRSITVCATEPGEVAVSVLRGRRDPVQGPAEEAVGVVEGGGWVISAEGELEVDDRKESSPSPSSELPVPFFRSAHCTGRMQFIRSLTACALIDEFSIGDEAALKARDFKVQNISDVTNLASFFPNGEAYEAAVASHLNTANWTCPVPPGVSGLLIRKIYDRFHGRQRARVLVDGEVAGWWYEPFEDRLTRWAIADFGIDERLVTGKTEIRLAIDPPPGTPLWSVSSIQTFALSTPKKV